MRHTKRILYIHFFCLVFLFFSGCKKSQLELSIIVDKEYERVVDLLNNSVKGLSQIVEAQKEGKIVTMFTHQNQLDGSVNYLIQMEDESQISLCGSIYSEYCFIPDISIVEDNGHFYWIFNQHRIYSSDGSQIGVVDETDLPHFFYLNGAIGYSFCSNSESFTITDSIHKSVTFLTVDFDSDESLFILRMLSDVCFQFPVYDCNSFLKQDVKNEAFYKDVFLDAGVGLTSRKSLYASKALGLSLEGISFSRSADVPEENELQYLILAGCDEDTNGRLLYPDGQPRYKLLFVNGGSSTIHGKSLGENGRKRMCEFVANGGSYVGTCAGAFFASDGCDRHDGYLYYLHIWPGMMKHTDITNGSTGISLEPNSPLLNYYSFGEDRLVADVRHNGGGYPGSLPDGTEILARYYCPEIQNVHEKPSIWSYKSNINTGRVLMEGSHPEGASQGEQLDLTAAMMLYAIDGRGVVSIKGYLRNGDTRVMDSSSSENRPSFSRIGDMQCHHFATYIPHGAKDVSFKIQCQPDVLMRLMLCRDTYAFESTADYVEYSKEGIAELRFINLEEGIWYIGAQCLTTVSVSEAEFGQQYVGRTDVLNGIPYLISASWK